MIAKVYEEFLAYLLSEKNGRIVSELKSEYVKSNGAIPTDAAIARIICQETIHPSEIDCADTLLGMKILDPCCGSGIFLVAAYETLAGMLRHFDSEERKFCIEYNGNRYLSLDAKREIMKECLYGIDMDPTAIEVTKMSLALKMIDDVVPEVYSDCGIFGGRILRDIHRNIVCGNTLVDGNINNICLQTMKER